MMLSFLGSAVSGGGMFALVGADLDALFAYGLLAFLIGLIAWSKYNEPALSNPYPDEKSGRELPGIARHAEMGPIMAVPVVAQPALARKRP